ncbi:hypothetical protein [Pseudohoeflea coraliihabitans]|uniref:Uncharacterized protein n=1 Tax=Pseudohoeflea coraliihabitans TaxID=2860393 RepID=A0ABS6WNA5_9HYPH|nr:hypothetical protein [Pseudohoeflea sp. DP4N28-3]MBW3097143.1 hypothetical protein [Pseudohoeflea sp. DP4N28-3]
MEIEDIVKFSVYNYLESKQGFETLPGFRAAQKKAMLPWIVTNEGHLFGGSMPKRIIYPAVGIEYRPRS